MNKIHLILLLVLFPVILSFRAQIWGFYAHRLINRLAVFTLPTECISLYKQNLGYIEEHAIDPDKRRYSISEEAIRHYIDIDHWGPSAIDSMPEYFELALIEYGVWTLGDSTKIQIEKSDDSVALWCDDLVVKIYQRDLTSAMQSVTRYVYEVPEYRMPADSVPGLQGVFPNEVIRIENVFSEYGILPFHLVRLYNRLEKAFFDRKMEQVIRLSTELGHYVSDAHVPLHTTENYNGQLTNQVGIHGFWESRIPELFAESEYDFFVGQAKYIPDVRKFVWEIIRQSHSHVDSVLLVEKRLRETYPDNKQFCFEDRLDQTIRTQCPEFAKAYSLALDGMVENRMRAAILNLGSLWFTAWVNAGQPNLSEIHQKVLFTKSELQELKIQQESKVLGRPHGN